MSLRLRVSPATNESFSWDHPGSVITIGRSPQAELSFPKELSQTVSWEHARIEITATGAFVNDLNSTNGTFVNDSQISERTPLKCGDCIRLGSQGPKLVVEQVQPPERPTDKKPKEPSVRQRPSKQAAPAPIRRGRVRRVSAAVSVMFTHPTGSFFSRMPPWLSAVCIFSLSVPAALLVAALVIRGGSKPAADSNVPTQDGAYSNQGSAADVPAAAQALATQGPPAKLPPLVIATETAKTSIASADPASQQVKEVLTKYCHRCHGEGGSNEGGFNFVLNRGKLITSGYVEPGNAGNSHLLQRVNNGEMPPAGEEPMPTKAEIALLKQWIDAGATEFNPRTAGEFITTQVIFQSIAQDLKEANERDRRFRRYFSIAHLANSGSTDDELQTYRNALAKLVNSLSWRREIVIPKPLNATGTLLRIDLRDYDWSAEVWEEIVVVNPYTVIYDSPVAQECYRTAGTKVPYLNADWFVFKASRPPLYEKVLRLPETDVELERMLMVDATRNIQQETVVRAGFNASGVSQHNRLIERHESTYGAYWKSYDFASSTGRQNLFQHPLGPAGALPAKLHTEPFVADGGEIIFNLPNGLQAYLLIDAKGRRIERGPVQIVSDPKQSDRSVVNGISCMSCHYAGIIKKGDEIRSHILANRPAFPEADDILALYRPRDVMEPRMVEDAERFRRAVEKTGSSISRSGEPVVNIAQKFEQDLDLTTAAAEVGATPEQFKKQIEQSPQLRRMLGPLLVEGGTLKRQVYVESFSEIARSLQLPQSLGTKPVSRKF